MDKIIEIMPDVEHWPEWAQDALNEGRLFTGCMERIADLERQLADAGKEIHKLIQIINDDNVVWSELDEVSLKLAEAQGNARILAHAYEHDARPPTKVVKQSMAYPINTTKWIKDNQP